MSSDNIVLFFFVGIPVTACVVVVARYLVKDYLETRRARISADD